MLKHLGESAINWLASTMTNIIHTSKIPAIWKTSKIIAILKPGKPAKEAASYRPIALLSCTFNRITPLIHEYIPPDQAGFRKHRNTTEQVLALTTHIESGFERKLKTGAVFVDLSAAYDVVWHDGLMLKLAKTIKCKKILRLLSRITGTRYIYTCLGGDTRKTIKIKNGVPQGSVLALTLFNIYLSDMPTTTSLKFGYADDWALTCQAPDISSIERTLTSDLTAMHAYFDKWYLQMNTTKTVSSLFHLDNHQSDRKLKIIVDNKQLPADPFPKYLGITLDRTLTYLINTFKKQQTN